MADREKTIVDRTSVDATQVDGAETSVDVGSEDPTVVHPEERTIIGSDSYAVDVCDPVRASLFSFLVWGSGLLYVGFPIPAATVLLVLLLTLVLFLSVTGVAPYWFAEPFLSDIGWPYPLGPSILISGAVFVGIWWLSIVIATGVALRSLPFPFRPVERTWRKVLLWPCPVLPFYLEGKFIHGHLDALFLMTFLFSSVATFGLWTKVDPSFPVGVEPYLQITGTAAVIGGCGLFLNGCFRFVRSFFALGWVTLFDREKKTDWKFVALGSALIGLVFFHLFHGAPGERLRKHWMKYAAAVEEKGFSDTAEVLKRPARYWERKADAVNDGLSLFQ